MGCDIAVALGRATVGGATLFALNQHSAGNHPMQLRRFPARAGSPDEMLSLTHARLPQVRHTATVLGCQPVGEWGLCHGLNEHHVVAGFAQWSTRLDADSAEGLFGTELIRLALERSRSAGMAVDVLTDLIGRHGQAGATADLGGSNVFLVADGREAFLVEAAGTYWAVQQCEQARAVTDAGMIRQDWDRLAPGLSTEAVRRGWWRDEGRKLDFAGALGQPGRAHRWCLKRWGRATLLLEQQHGAIDAYFLRKMLHEHYEALVADPAAPIPSPIQVTFLAQVSAEEDALPVAWWAFGSPANALFRPLFVHGDLPDFLTYATALEPGVTRDSLERRQLQLDQEAEDLIAEARSLLQKGQSAAVTRLTTQFMQRGRHAQASAEASQTQPRSVSELDLAYVCE